MALYNEISADVLSNILAADEENRKRKQLEAYNQQKAKLDNKYSSNNGGLGGFLGSIVGGIGKGIGDVAKGTFGVIGGGAAAIKDLAEGKAGSMENQNAFKRWLYDADSDKDAAAKAAGTGLNAATTLASTVVPGLAGTGSVAGKLGTSAIANAAEGAIGGVADELQQQGANASLESAANRALSGAAAGLVTGGLNRKIGNATGNLSSKLLNNKVATSAIGRGALSGAVGGATGAGTSAALGGGDIAQAALQGGLTGAVSGGTQAGLMSGANALKQGIQGKLTAKPQPTTVTEPTIGNDYTKPEDWSGNEVKIEKKGVIGGLGKKLEGVAKGVKNREVYNTLSSKTAEKIDRNNSIERLRELGYEPKDYAEAAKVSTTTNKFIDDVIKNSDASVVDNDFVNRVSQPLSGQVIESPAYQKTLDAEIKGLVGRLEKGNMPGRYKAADLLDESRRFMDLSDTHRTKGINATNGQVQNTNEAALAAYYKNIGQDLRSMANKAMDGFNDNYTKSQLATRLKNAGANDKTIEYVTNFDSLNDAVRNTALFEDARTMAREMNKTKIRRNATSGNDKNLINIVTEATGLNELARAGAEPIGRVTGAVAEGASKGLQKIDDVLQRVEPISQPTSQYLGNIIGRTQGQTAAGERTQNARKTQDYQNLEDMLATSMDNIESEYAPLRAAQAQNVSPAQSQLADIANGMSLALAAGDIAAYNQLANLYQTAYKMYELQNPTATSNKEVKLSKTQQQANAAALALDELENMNPDFGYTVKDIPLLNLVNATGNKYSSTADSLAMQIGYMLSGANIKEDEAKKIGSAYVPQPFDDDATRRYKLQQARNIIQQYQNTYVTDANNA